MENKIDQTILSFIKTYIEDYKVVVFMKGTPHMPYCGFSAKVVSIFKMLDVDFIGVNVLENNTLREAMKIYSDWPTFPQVYINGEFIGGCDIITAMHEQGELQKLLTDLLP